MPCIRASVMACIVGARRMLPWSAAVSAESGWKRWTVCFDTAPFWAEAVILQFGHWNYDILQSDPYSWKKKLIWPPDQFLFLFLFVIVFYSKKLRKRSVDDVAFIEFDRNFNFVPDDILPDVVARLRNQENCSPCRMDFLHNEIVDSLMEQ